MGVILSPFETEEIVDATPGREKRFIFHANAVALAAHIRRRAEFLVPAIASSCLPVTGGIGQANEKGRDFQGIISFGSASSSVYGDYADRSKAAGFTHGNHADNDLPTVTVSEAAITDLRIKIGDRTLEVANLRAHMHAFSDRKSPPSFHEISVTFDKVKVDGAVLRVDDHCSMFAEQDTKAKLCAAFAADPGFRKRYVDAFYPVPESKSRLDIFRKTAVPEARGIIVGTVVSRLEWESVRPDKADIDGNRLTVGGLGTIHFGEIVIEENSRRLTLLRFQLGCPDGGEGAAVEISSNGTPWPPQRDDG